MHLNLGKSSDTNRKRREGRANPRENLSNGHVFLFVPLVNRKHRICVNVRGTFKKLQLKNIWKIIIKKREITFRLTLIQVSYFFRHENIYRIWILPRYFNKKKGERRRRPKIYAAKREPVEGHLILYAVLNGGIARASHTYYGDTFLANNLETPSWRRSERGAATGREILPANGFAQSLAFSSSFSANSYPARNFQFRMLRAYGDTNIISIHITRLNNSFYQNRLNT